MNDAKSILEVFVFNCATVWLLFISSITPFIYRTDSPKPDEILIMPVSTITISRLQLISGTVVRMEWFQGLGP